MNQNMKRLPYGINDFEAVIEQNQYYVHFRHRKARRYSRLHHQLFFRRYPLFHTNITKRQRLLFRT